MRKVVNKIPVYILCKHCINLNFISRFKMPKIAKLTRLPAVFFFPFLQVTSWSAYGPCVAPPGKCSANSGKKTRTRTIKSFPSCGGKACPSLIETPSCTPVPIKCKVILILLSMLHKSTVFWNQNK